jgi:uncharacterized membrane protein YoaK (UPF0700 family)
MGHLISYSHHHSGKMFSFSSAFRLSAKEGVALMLTFVAGFVDIVGYRNLYQTFVANMTGNTVHLANNVVERNCLAALPASVIAAFVTASVGGRAIIETGARHNIQRVASFTLLLELAMIASVTGFAAAGPSTRAGFWMLIMLAASMGLQTVTLTRVGPLSVHTTFVTGMLNKLAQLISHALFLTYDIVRGQQGVRAHRGRVMRQGVYMFSIWLLYFVGAVIGTIGSLRFGLRVLLLPVVFLAIAIFVDQARPLSLQEEQDDLEQGA